MTFEQFHNRIIISAQLVAITPIFIGARSDSFKPGAINGSCVKDAYGRPYIPGSSIKGVLRAFLSSVENEPIKSEVSDIFGSKNDREQMKDSTVLAEKIYQQSTAVEHLFGSTLMAGKVKIADALPVTDNVITEVRNGVAIDRDSHTALSNSGALFDTEVIPSGTGFKFMASAENLTAEEAEMFGKLMQFFADGNIAVGGRSRAGLGSVKLYNIKTTVYYKGEDGFPVAKEEESIAAAVKGVCRCLQD